MFRAVNAFGPRRQWMRAQSLQRIRKLTGVGLRGRSIEKDREFMANTKSAKKAARQMVSRTEINKNRRSAVKTEVRRVEEAIASGNKEAAVSALQSAQPSLVRTAQKGVMHPKTASRKVSRLAQRIKAMA
jgi:small subunit ribosomal protein S20